MLEQSNLDNLNPILGLKPGSVISHYRIIEQIGSGGMGVIYKATDLRLERPVALKLMSSSLLLDENSKTRFIREAKAASSLNHLNIATIYSYEDIGTRSFITMEFIEGCTLRHLISTGKMPLDRIFDIIIQICEGLKAAHTRGILHRDIKPENIMLTKDGVAKITDFGLAKMKEASTITGTGALVGTLYYMSPEQALGGEADERSDIYSFGTILYEMVAGIRPHDAPHEAALLYAIVNETYKPLHDARPDIPIFLEKIVDRALQKKREHRYPIIDEMLVDLKNARERYRQTKELDHKKRQISPYRKFHFPGAAPFKSIRKLPYKNIASMAAIFLVVLFFVLYAFNAKSSPEFQTNTMAIVYFENLADRSDMEGLCEISTELLTNAILDSSYVNIISSYKLHKYASIGAGEPLDKYEILDIAAKLKAKWMIFGSILRLRPRVIVMAKLVDVFSGRIESSLQVTGNDNDDIYSLIPILASKMKRTIPLPLEAEIELLQPAK